MAVSFQGILQARPAVYRHLRPTPLLEYPLLSRKLGCRVFVKHENHNPTGSFKIRGGINLIGGLSSEERSRGVITATRGNHGQSIALASRLFGVECIVGVPEGNNPEKNASMEAFGAKLMIHGRDFDEARLKVESVQAERGMRYVHSANEPMLIHGVGTYAVELFEDLPDVDYVFVPVGGGSGISGVLTAGRAMVPRVRIIGVQAEKAASVYLSWKQGRRVETPSAETLADGLATRVPFELTFSIIQRLVDDMVTVNESDLRAGIYEFFYATHNVAEGAAAATLAAAWNYRSRLKGSRVALILSGCNIQTSLFREILEQAQAGQLAF